MPIEGIDILPAAADDAQVYKTFAAAFGPRRPFTILMPGVTSDGLAQWIHSKQDSTMKGVSTFKAVDTKTGQVAAWMKWICHQQKQPGQETQQSVESKSDFFPPEANIDLLKSFFEEMSAKLKEIGQSFGGPYQELSILGVRPEYERKGIGAALVAKGIAMADEANVPVIVSASEAGAPLYRRFGFKDVDSFSIQGEDGTRYVETQLVRPAPGT